MTSLLPNQTDWTRLPEHLPLSVRTADGAAATQCTRCKVAERYHGTMKDFGRWIQDTARRHERCDVRLLSGEAAE